MLNKWNVFCLLFGALVVVTMGNSIWRGLSTLKWPHVIGHIYSVEKHHPGSVPSEEVFRQHITYHYELDGHTFRSRQLSCEPEIITRLASYIGYSFGPSKFSEGHSVIVYYNPESPDDAVIRPGVSLPAWLAFAAGMLAILISIIDLKRASEAH